VTRHAFVLVAVAFASLAARTAPAAPCASPPWIVDGDQSNARFGTIAWAGDVNGDGYDDAIAGAYDESNGQLDEGRVAVFLGGPGGLATTPAWTFEPNQANANLGDKVSGAGDVNGDGYDDLVVGAAGYDSLKTDAGRAYLFLGGPNGPASSPAWVSDGDQAGGTYGSCVRPAGDVNGDGYADVIVGAWLYDAGALDTGKAFLYLGGPAGLAHAPAWTGQGELASSVYGYFVNGIGDVNHDGYADIAVGARRYSGTSTRQGKVYVYYGSPAGPATVASWTATGAQRNGELGCMVSGAGDVNGDGFDDLLAGAYRQSNSDSAEGRAYLWLGGAGGLQPAYAWVADGDQYNAGFGYHLTTAGDVNRDGYADVIVSAVTHTVNGLAGAGRVYLYEGGAGGLSPYPEWTFDGDQAGARLGDAVTNLGDVNGDGFADFGAGGLYHDTASLTDCGRAYAWRGGVDCWTTAVAAPPRDGTGVTLALAGANPFVATARVAFTLPRATAVRLRVLDAAGRLVRALPGGALAAGRHEAVWDGRDAAGAPAPAGAYFVELRAAGASHAVSVVKLR